MERRDDIAGWPDFSSCLVRIGLQAPSVPADERFSATLRAYTGLFPTALRHVAYVYIMEYVISGRDIVTRDTLGSLVSLDHQNKLIPLSFVLLILGRSAVMKPVSE
jgi:hypothetical protein